jgi:hypothetical protein
MTLRRRHRILAALVATLSLLFGQVVFAGFACSGMGIGLEMSAPICQLHCDYEKQSLDTAKPPPPLPQAVPVVMRIELPAPLPLPQAAFSPDSRAAGPAPPLIRSTVLRI